jgi:hypothetical protein
MPRQDISTPLVIQTNSRDGPAEREASTQLTEFAETASPSDASIDS